MKRFVFPIICLVFFYLTGHFAFDAIHPNRRNVEHYQARYYGSDLKSMEQATDSYRNQCMFVAGMFLIGAGIYSWLTLVEWKEKKISN